MSQSTSPQTAPRGRHTIDAPTKMLGALLSLILAALNPVLKPLYDAFYRSFLVVRAPPCRFPEGTAKSLNLESSDRPLPD